MRRIGLVISVAVGGLLLFGTVSAAQTTAIVPAQTIRSADGLLTLVVPRGALKKKTRMQVLLLKRAHWPKQLRRAKDTKGLKLYELKPDGLRFKKPITLIRRFPGFDLSDGQPGLSFASRSSRGKWEVLRNQSVKLKGKTVVASATTTHFSSVTAFDNGLRLTMTPARVETTVGEKWRVSIEIEGGEGHVEWWTHTGVVKGNSLSSQFECGSVGTGTFGGRTLTTFDKLSLPDFAVAFMAGAKPAGSEISAPAVCKPKGSSPPPPPPPAPPPPPPPAPPPPPPPLPTTCSQPAAMTFTMYQPPAAPAPSEHVQVTGQCDGLFADDLDAIRVEMPSGSQSLGWSAHTTGCATPPSGPWVYVECKIKPDGRICVILKVDPPPTAGTQFRVQLKRSNGSVLVDQTVTANASEPHCQVGG